MYTRCAIDALDLYSFVSEYAKASLVDECRQRLHLAMQSFSSEEATGYPVELDRFVRYFYSGREFLKCSTDGMDDEIRSIISANCTRFIEEARQSESSTKKFLKFITGFPDISLSLLGSLGAEYRRLKLIQHSPAANERQEGTLPVHEGLPKDNDMAAAGPVTQPSTRFRLTSAEAPEYLIDHTGRWNEVAVHQPGWPAARHHDLPDAHSTARKRTATPEAGPAVKRAKKAGEPKDTHRAARGTGKSVAAPNLEHDGENSGIGTGKHQEKQGARVRD
jgi:hypothetical protein